MEPKAYPTFQRFINLLTLPKMAREDETKMSSSPSGRDGSNTGIKHRYDIMVFASGMLGAPRPRASSSSSVKAPLWSPPSAHQVQCHAA